MPETQEETEIRHKKELKALDGEKRAALKKCKATAGKGKKAKEITDLVEAEYEEKRRVMEERHSNETATHSVDEDTVDPLIVDDVAVADNPENQDSPEKQERQRKLERIRRKREQQREKERAHEKAILDEKTAAGPSPRDVEMARILQLLTPLNLKITEVAADGHCLYRAVGAECGETDYQAMRNLCAETLHKHEMDFAPFCELDDDAAPDFNAYVERVRTTAVWGGHLELRALSLALQRSMHIYSAQSSEPLVIPYDGDDTAEPIRLSYHLHYYALGEHYNQVVPNAN